MYMDTVVIASLIAVIATIGVGVGFYSFVAKDIKKHKKQ